MPWRIIAFALISSISTEARAASHEVDGLVVSLDREGARLTVAHRPVPGLMPAMTMPFRVHNPKQLVGIAPGMRVRFRLKQDRDGSWARNIVPVPPDESGMPKPERTLRPGEPAPDFELTDQTGTPTRLSSLRGKVVAINFVYTRCPVPEVCPRLGAAFAAAHRRFQGRDLMLLSVTIDPVHDTPQVLAEYAKRWRARDEQWRFLTGTPRQIADVGRAWGLVYWAEEGAVAHTARTYIIDRGGVIAAVIEGTSWRADQLADLIAAQLEAQ